MTKYLIYVSILICSTAYAQNQTVYLPDGKIMVCTTVEGRTVCR